MDSAASSVMLERLHRMSRLALCFIVIVSAALAAPRVIAQPATQPAVAKPAAATPPAPPKSPTATPGAKPATKPGASPATKAATKATNATTATKKGAKKPPKNAPVVLLHVNRHDVMSLALGQRQTDSIAWNQTAAFVDDRQGRRLRVQSVVDLANKSLKPLPKLLPIP